MISILQKICNCKKYLQENDEKKEAVSFLLTASCFPFLGYCNNTIYTHIRTPELQCFVTIGNCSESISASVWVYLTISGGKPNQNLTMKRTIVFDVKIR